MIAICFSRAGARRCRCVWRLICVAVLLMCAPAAMPGYDDAKMKEIEKLDHDLTDDPEVAKKVPCPKVGEVTVDIATIVDPNYHYSVYLPKQYDPKLEWPVIFCNSPGGNAKNYCEMYKAFADEFGWILCGSTECSNTVAGAGQFENNLAMIVDACHRFKVHKEMSIFLGFSGGARVGETWCFGPMVPWAMGTIQMGAGNGGSPVTSKKNCQVYLIIGDTDSNLSETREFAKKAMAAGHKTVLIEYKAGHQNAPPEMVREAIRWHTETFLKSHPDKSPATLRLRKAWIEKFIQAAKATEAAGDKVATYVQYRAAVDEAAGMPIGEDTRKAIAEIQNKVMKELLKDNAVKKESQAFAEYSRMLAWAKALPQTKAGLTYAPQQFETIAKKYPDQPSGKAASQTAQQYKDQIAAMKE